MRKSKQYLDLILAVLLLGVFTLSACSGTAEKGDKPSEDWSRSIAMGDEVTGSIGLLAEGNGQKVHLVWPFESQNGRRLSYVQMDKAANPIVTRELSFPGHLRTPRLAPAGADQLHLFWASRQAGQTDWALWHVLLDGKGHPTGAPTNLLEAGDKVGKFVVVSDRNDGAILAWDRGFESELKILQIGSRGEILAGPLAITDQGTAPSLQLDAAGRAHLAWLKDRSFYYAMLEKGSLRTLQKLEAVNLSIWGVLGTLGDVLDGPSLGVSNDWVYIFWSILSIKDTEAGSAVMEYVAFPSHAPAPSQPVRIWTVPAERQPYTQVESSFALTELSSPISIYEAADQYGRSVEYYHELAGDWVDVVGAVSPMILSPRAMHGQGDELAVTMSISQEKRQAFQQQIAAGIFSHGEFQGYTISGSTPNFSDDPVLMVDQDGDLHVAWREGPKGKQVYYATTTAESKATLDRVTSRDVFNFVMVAGMEGFTSMMLFPVMGLSWILPGLILMGLWSFRGGRDSLREPSTWFPFLVAIALFIMTKLIFLPTILTYTPFSAWASVPGKLALPMRIAVPVIIFAISLLAAYALRQRFAYSPIIVYLTIVLIDSLLTLSIYGVNFMGAV